MQVLFPKFLLWCPSLVDLLAPGVFFTGMVKDFLCLPRPLSPPLQRITMSGLTALEYGFPSTHSTNAISVALYCLTLLDSSDHGFSAVNKTILQSIIWLYAFSVVMGRIYCGMHGFLGDLWHHLRLILRLHRRGTYGSLVMVGENFLWRPPRLFHSKWKRMGAHRCNGDNYFPHTYPSWTCRRLL